MIRRTESAVRKEISTWPDGIYHAEAQTDDDGLNLEERVTIRVKLTIQGDEVTFDFSDSDPERKGNINFTYPATFSDTLCSTFLFLGTHLSSYHNEGSLRPIHVVTKEGTVVHCRPGSLTAASPAITGGTVIEAVLLVMSKVLPDRSIAPYAKLISPILVGRDKRDTALYLQHLLLLRRRGRRDRIRRLSELLRSGNARGRQQDRCRGGDGPVPMADQAL